MSGHAPSANSVAVSTYANAPTALSNVWLVPRTRCSWDAAMESQSGTSLQLVQLVAVHVPYVGPFASSAFIIGEMAASFSKLHRRYSAAVSESAPQSRSSIARMLHAVGTQSLQVPSS
jgi:hypothetical protein